MIITFESDPNLDRACVPLIRAVSGLGDGGDEIDDTRRMADGDNTPGQRVGGCLGLRWASRRCGLWRLRRCSGRSGRWLRR